MSRSFENLRVCLGLAAIPAIGLGAFGYSAAITVPVLLSSWLTSFVAISLKDERP